MTEAIEVGISPRGIASILLNRPERSNAFDQPMLNALAEQCARLGTDERVRANEFDRRFSAFRSSWRDIPV